MSQSLAPLPLVLEIFAFLFSNHWIGCWQRKWQAQKRLAQSGPARAGSAQDSQKKNRKKPAQGRFYQRIFSLRVTLWYLIFQRLNFDQTLAAVVANLREGGADRGGILRAQWRGLERLGRGDAAKRPGHGLDAQSKRGPHLPFGLGIGTLGSGAWPRRPCVTSRMCWCA